MKRMKIHGELTQNKTGERVVPTCHAWKGNLQSDRWQTWRWTRTLKPPRCRIEAGWLPPRKISSFHWSSDWAAHQRKRRALDGTWRTGRVFWSNPKWKTTSRTHSDQWFNPNIINGFKRLRWNANLVVCITYVATATKGWGRFCFTEV